MKARLAVLVLLASLVAPAHAAMIHEYDLNGTFADNLLGPALVSQGGTLGGSGYAFGPAQGLSLATPGITGSYRIELVFNLDTVCNTKYCKLIDFKNLASDTGLYTAPNNQLNLYNIAIGGTPVGNSSVTVAISRDAAGTFNAFLDGALQFTVADAGGIGSISDNILWFFHDEGQQGTPGEHPTGFVDRIRIFDTPEGTAVPEPGSLLLGLTALLAARSRKRSHA